MGLDEEVFLAMFKIRKTCLVKELIVIAMVAMFIADATDTNDVYSPCQDAKVQSGDGFTFGIAFSTKQSFTPDNGPQLSPCDSRLDLAGKGAQLALFRPKVDEISLLTVNRSTLDPVWSSISSRFKVERINVLYKSLSLFRLIYLIFSIGISIRESVCRRL
jgi:hypothetical protein